MYFQTNNINSVYSVNKQDCNQHRIVIHIVNCILFDDMEHIYHFQTNTTIYIYKLIDMTMCGI